MQLFCYSNESPLCKCVASIIFLVAEEGILTFLSTTVSLGKTIRLPITLIPEFKTFGLTLLGV